jgi:hypothetical protein
MGAVSKVLNQVKALEACNRMGIYNKKPYGSRNEEYSISL